MAKTYSRCTKSFFQVEDTVLLFIMNELKVKVSTLLRADTILRSLLGKSASPYGIYFSRPPVTSPPFPLVTFKVIGGSISDAGRDCQTRSMILQVTAYSATNCDAIMEQVERLLNQVSSFTGMTTCSILNITLDSVGPDDFDVEFNCYTLTHRYRVFLIKKDT